MNYNKKFLMLACYGAYFSKPQVSILGYTNNLPEAISYLSKLANTEGLPEGRDLTFEENLRTPIIITPDSNSRTMTALTDDESVYYQIITINKRG